MIHVMLLGCANMSSIFEGEMGKIDIIKSVFLLKDRQRLFLINLRFHAKGPSLISTICCHVVCLESVAPVLYILDQ